MKKEKTDVHGNDPASNVVTSPPRVNMFSINPNALSSKAISFLSYLTKANMLLVTIFILSFSLANLNGIRTINIDAPDSDSLHVGVDGLRTAVNEAKVDTTHTVVYIVLYGQSYDLDQPVCIHMEQSHIKTLHIRSAYGAEDCMIKALPPVSYGGPYGRAFIITSSWRDYDKKVIFSDIHFWYDGGDNTIILHKDKICGLELRDNIFDTFGTACQIEDSRQSSQNPPTVKIHNNTFIRHFNYNPDDHVHMPWGMIKLLSTHAINFELSNNDFQNAYFPLCIAAARLNGIVINNSFIAPKIIFPYPPHISLHPDMADTLNCITIGGSYYNGFRPTASIIVSENYLENVNITIGAVKNATISNNVFVHSQDSCYRDTPLLSIVNYDPPFELYLPPYYDYVPSLQNHIHVYRNIFWSNAQPAFGAVAIKMYQHPHDDAVGTEMFVDINQNSFMSNACGVRLKNDTNYNNYYIDMHSCFFSDNTQPLQTILNLGYPNVSFDVHHCLFNDQIPTGNPDINIDTASCLAADPKIAVNPHDYSYTLIWTSDVRSPLINSGYRGVNNELTDPDGTPPDIGSIYYPHHHMEYEFNYLQLGSTPPAHRIFWRSFPVLDDRTCTDNVWHNELRYLFSNHMYPPNLQLENVSWSYGGDDDTMQENGDSWYGGDYQATQPKGFKISFEGGTDPISSIVVDGFKANPATTPVEWYRGTSGVFENWIGYFVPYTQGVGDAFSRALPDNLNETYLDHIYEIKAQHWCARRESDNYGSQWLTDPNTYTVSEGDMLAIKLFPNAPEEMYWACLGAATPRIRELPQQFNYNEELDYKPIFIQFDPDNLPDEVGLMVAGECKGAAVVDSSLIEVNYYPTAAKGDDEIEILFYYGSKGMKKAPTPMVYNHETLLFEAGSLRASQIGDYGYISFSHEAGSSLVPLVTELKQNYPNPFRGNTTISWVMEKDEPIRIEIYNLRGQKVTTLYDGFGKKGRQSINWDARDAKGQSVASGVYFYRLSTPKESKVQKMMVIKH